MKPRTSERTWLGALRGRITTLAWLKALGNALFLIVFFQLYLAIQKHPQFEVTQISSTFIDQWIGFQPWTIGLYLSLWVYTALPLAVQPDTRGMVRYGVSMTVLCALGLLVFYFWPSSVSDAVGHRPAENTLFAMMYAVDSNGNACPSLHVGAAVLSCLWLHASLRQLGAPFWTRAANVVWCVGIVFSTMATKQHLLLDVLAGAVLGLAVGWASLRGGRPV